MLGTLRDIRQVGPAEVLRKLNLTALSSAPAGDIMLALMDVVCPAGGTIDDSIARHAMAEAICELTESGAADITADNLEDFFLSFVVHSIEGRIVADIGARGIKLPSGGHDLQEQLHDFIAGCTRAEVKSKIGDLSRVSDKQLGPLMDSIYEMGFELVALSGEED